MKYDPVKSPQRNVEQESLKEELSNSLSEARMILPGIQALLGFQTVAVFNERFEALPSFAQYVHLASLLLIAFAGICALSPAAFNRISAPDQAVKKLLKITSALLCAALFFLSVALALDVYVVFIAVSNIKRLSLAAAIGIFSLCTIFWFIFPFFEKKHTKPIP